MNCNSFQISLFQTFYLALFLLALPYPSSYFPGSRFHNEYIFEVGKKNHIKIFLTLSSFRMFQLVLISLRQTQKSRHNFVSQSCLWFLHSPIVASRTVNFQIHHWEKIKAPRKSKVPQLTIIASSVGTPTTRDTPKRDIMPLFHPRLSRWIGA